MSQSLPAQLNPSGQAPFSRNGPVPKQVLTPDNLNSLPMFAPLNRNSFVPVERIFQPYPFFQAQGSMQPRINHGTQK